MEGQRNGSLSRAKNLTPPAPAVPTREATCCIQLVTKLGPMTREVSAGSFPVMFVPSGLTPFPASGLHQEGLPVVVHSVCC